MCKAKLTLVSFFLDFFFVHLSLTRYTRFTKLILFRISTISDFGVPIYFLLFRYNYSTFTFFWPLSFLELSQNKISCDQIVDL